MDRQTWIGEGCASNKKYTPTPLVQSITQKKAFVKSKNKNKINT